MKEKLNRSSDSNLRKMVIYVPYSEDLDEILILETDWGLKEEGVIDGPYLVDNIEPLTEDQKKRLCKAGLYICEVELDGHITPASFNGPAEHDFWLKFVKIVDKYELLI